MFTDERRSAVYNQIRQQDSRWLSRYLTPTVFLEAARRTGRSIVQSPLNLVNLVWLGVLAAVHAADSFCTVLTITLKLLEDHEHFGHCFAKKLRQRQPNQPKARRRSKHDPRGDDPTAVTEEAWAKARRIMPLEFWLQLIVILGEQFQARHAARHRFGGFRVLVLDGTRIDLPDRPKLKAHFGAAKNKSGVHNAQARLVMLSFPFTRLPFRYELTPLADAEMSVALRLVGHLAADDLVLMDAGYWSYQLLWAIAARGAFFALRLRRRLNLRTLRRLDRAGRERLVEWRPSDTRGNWRKLGLPRTMQLRLIEYRVPGFRKQTIVSNVLDPKRLSREDFTRLTTECEEAGGKLLPGLFHRRWEIETSFRELKVEQGLDRHLRSRTPQSIYYEVAGHMVFYLLVRWLLVEAAEAHGADPLRLSFLDAVRELKAIWGALLTSSERWVEQHLMPQLLERIASHRVPVRPGRHYPRRHKKGSAKKHKQTRTTNKVRKQG